MDMNDLASVRAFASSFAEPVLNVLVNNAGIMNTPFALTKDGIEAQYQVTVWYRSSLFEKLLLLLVLYQYRVTTPSSAYYLFLKY